MDALLEQVPVVVAVWHKLSLAKSNQAILGIIIDINFILHFIYSK